MVQAEHNGERYYSRALTDNLPSYPINPNLCLKNLGFTPAEPQFHKPRTEDILIGSDIYPKIIAQESEFGWILFGPIVRPLQNSSIISFQIKIKPKCRLTRLKKVQKIQKELILSISHQFCEENI